MRRGAARGLHQGAPTLSLVGQMSDPLARDAAREIDRLCRQMASEMKIPAFGDSPEAAPAPTGPRPRRPTLHLLPPDVAGRLVPSAGEWTRSLSRPEQSLWIPAIAGAVAVVFETDPLAITSDLVPVSALLATMVSLGEPAELDGTAQVALCNLALAGLPRLQEWLPPALLPLAAELPAEATHEARRIEAERWLAEGASEHALPWIALALGCAVPAGRPGIKDFLEAKGPYARLAEQFHGLATGRRVSDWHGMLWTATEYWRETRGRLTLQLMLPKRAAPKAARQPAPATVGQPRPEAAPLLEKLERQLAEARRELREVRDQAATRQRALGSAQQQILEAKQSRDRAVAHLHRLEVELAEAREFIRRPRPRPEPTPAPAPPVAPAAPVVVPPSPVRLRPEQVFRGRNVYVFTGIERAGARREMCRVLEQSGAACQVYDGNRHGVGPARFPEDAIVIIDTRKLCHSAAGAIAARAAASGAWYFLGPTGRGSLMRVVEAWGRTH